MRRKIAVITHLLFLLFVCYRKRVYICIMFRCFARKKKEEHMHWPEQNQEQAKARAMEATDRLVEDRKKEAEREKIVCPIDAEAMNKCIGLEQVYIHNFYFSPRPRVESELESSSSSSSSSPSSSSSSS
jgi:hypothetical protein